MCLRRGFERTGQAVTLHDEVRRFPGARQRSGSNRLALGTPLDIGKTSDSSFASLHSPSDL